MNLPNKLTFIRLVLAVPFIYFLQESNAEGFVYRMIAFALFVVASLTDFFDGYLARKYNLVTDFGKLMECLLLLKVRLFQQENLENIRQQAR